MKKLFFAHMLITGSIQAQNSQGPLVPSFAENTSCPYSYSSTIDYLPAENAFESDNSYATASHCDCCDANTRCFETKGYGFTIPSTSTIEGILVEVEKKASGGSMVQDNGVKLLKAGTTVGTSQATADNWPFTDTYFSYGSATDLWGTTWTADEVNDSAFGLAIATISYTCFGNGSPVISYIDNVLITVFFKDIGTGISDPATQSAGLLTITPNPITKNTIQLSFPVIEESVTIFITDLSGKKMEEKILKLSAGKAQVNLNLPIGIYMLSARGLHNCYVQQLVVN
ncbi:MAG TPA: T9SS type A sorting domain-containing protein [Chitinophagales bacterium]|nr:T9SS type A sorting domain-containing protein [Chitinophagales bacterium]